MIKCLCSLLLSATLALLAPTSLAEGAVSISVGTPLQNLTWSATGNQTAGINYRLHDLYFDGNLLKLSITQSSIAEGVTIYEDELSPVDGDAFWATIGVNPSDSILGSYCTVKLYGPDGDEISGLAEGSGGPAGAVYTETHSFHFPPDQTHETIVLEIIYGVAETPASIDIATLRSFRLQLGSKQPESEIIPITTNESELDISEVLVTKTDDLIGVYLFYGEKFNYIPVDFTDALLETDAFSDTQRNAYDATRKMRYTYRAFANTPKVSDVYIYDRQSSAKFVLNLQNGTILKSER